jgi:hypothetical protein
MNDLFIIISLLITLFNKYLFLIYTFFFKDSLINVLNIDNEQSFII